MKLILIDVSSLAHRYWHAIKEPNAVIQGILRNLRPLQETLDADQLVFCFDSESHKRRDFYPEYKGNRTREGKEDLHRQINLLRLEILPRMGFANLIHQQGYESDDLIARICMTYTVKAGNEAIIVSTDTDMWQLLGRKVTIWNPAIKATYTVEQFRRDYKLEPRQWVAVKAVMGDKGDNIEGVDGVGEVLAVRYVRGESNPTFKSTQRINDSGTLITRNDKLIRLPWEGTMAVEIRKDSLSMDKWIAATVGYDVHAQHCPITG